MKQAHVKLETRNPEPETFVWPVRVYYEDTDAAGVVYYANYLRFMERARSEWLRALGFEHTELARAHGIAFVVRSVKLDFLRPAQFNDVLQVTVEPAGLHGSRIILAQRIMRDGRALVTAEISIACVNTASFKPVRIPRQLVETMETAKT